MAAISASGAICTTNDGGSPAPGPCAHAMLTSRPGAGGHRGASREDALGQRRTNLAHQLEVEVQVVQRRQLRAQHLVRQVQMAQGTSAEPATRVAGAVLVRGSRITRVTGVAD